MPFSWLRTNWVSCSFTKAESVPVQRALVREMGLRDLGINYDNLALVRPTWQPAVLCEGAFVIVPEQEAAMRTVEYQRRYAMGIVGGLEEYFIGLAAVRK